MTLVIFSGIILGAQALGKSGGMTFAGACMLIVGCGFGLTALADFLILVRVSLRH